MISIHAIVDSGLYESKDKQPLQSLNDIRLGEVSQAPELLVHRTYQGLLDSSPIDIEHVMLCMERASEIFLSDCIYGQSFEEACAAVNQMTGLPICDIQKAFEEISSFMRHIRETLSLQRRSLYCEERADGVMVMAYDRPNGEVFTAIMPGNHPAVNTVWLNALALGYKVLIKPAQDDPITAYRMMGALEAAGLPSGWMGFLPGKRNIIQSLITLSKDQRLMFFGGQAVEDMYGHLSHVIIRGPGYSKVFLDETFFLESNACLIENLAKSLSDSAGIKCTNASGILLDHVPVSDIFEPLRAHLNQLKARPLGHRCAQLQVYSIDKAKQLIQNLSSLNPEISEHQMQSELLVEFGDGTAAILPYIWIAETMPVRFEIPGVFAWIKSFRDEAELSSTLSLSLLSNDEKRLSNCLRNAKIRKVNVGLPTTIADPRVPHDGALYDQLFERVGAMSSAQQNTLLREQLPT